MHASETPAAPPPADPGLPPVKPLTAGYMVQLFVVPGMIVAGVVFVLLVFNWLNPFKASPEQFLRKLDDPNPDVRWRAAADLADVLRGNDLLAADVPMALGIAERLKKAMDDAAPVEKSLAERLPTLPADEAAAERKAREAERVFIQYLGSSLGTFRVPVGTKVLTELADSRDVADADELSRRRLSAIFALGLVGERSKSFEQLPPERQIAAMGTLEEEAAGSGERAAWARDALAVLKGRHQGQPTMLGLDQVFERLSHDPSADVRKFTAYAATPWEGSAEENRAVEDTLARLAQRPPAGSDDSAELQVCYNAASALAQRGSERTPLPVLAEMLDEPKLQQVFRITPPQGGDSVPDATAINATLLNALNGLEQLHAKRPSMDLASVLPPVEKLAGNAVPSVRDQAQKTLKALK